MKTFVLAGLLAVVGLSACSGPATEKPAATALAEDPTHAAVVAHLKKTLDDPASYQPARWGKVQPFQQREIDADNAAAEKIGYESQLDMAKLTTESYGRLVAMGADKKTLKGSKHRADTYLHRADSISKLMAKLETSTDTTRLGLSVVHAFRAKNKMGALVLDSARFIVFKDGKVTALKEHD